MEIEKILEKFKEAIIGEVKAELREFKVTVTGQLEGYKVALEAMNGRMSAIETDIRDLRRTLENTNKRIDDTNKRIDDTNMRIDETNRKVDELRDEIRKNTDRIDETNKRIDETNKRIAQLYLELSDIRGDLREALSRKEIIDDVLIRVQRLEKKVLAA